MSTFEQAINDIFSAPDFLETCLIGETYYLCIASAIPADSVFSEFGFAEGISFSLSVKVADVASRPKKNTLITYDGTQYRVAETTLDSAGLTWTIYLKSKNSL